ncbi:MAG TPA: tetratricopeptide repeat protein [Vicinamibacterales bacterium]|nr:tetratricopeptide repeat protein [Vicinamibacterales bacterium]
MAAVSRRLTAAQARRLESAYRQLQAGKAADALAIAHEVAAEVPDAADAQHLLAICLRTLRDYQAAESAYQRALQLAPGHAQILCNYANLLQEHSRRREALDLYRRAVQAAPQFMPAWLNLGLTALDDGAVKEALTALDNALRLQPGSATAWHGLGNARRAVGDLEGAEGAYRRSLELDPSRAAVWVNLGAALRLLGRPVEAVPCYDRAHLAGFTGPELLDARAGALLDLGELHAAVEETRNLLRRHPDFVPGHQTLAHILWEYGPAVAPDADPLGIFRRAASDQQDNLQLQMALIGFLLEAGEAGEALDRIDSLRQRADSALLVALQATALELLDRTGEAGALYEQAHRVLGSSDSSFLNVYVRHLLRVGRWDAAALRATEATQTDPYNQESWAYLGTAWRLLGDPREYWLCDYERFIGNVAVEPPAEHDETSAFFAALMERLDSMHKARRAPVHQSLRAGSQTPGTLFGRRDPLIAATQGAVLLAVERHVATLPDDADHPFLRRKARSVRFSGSWSVKLRSSGMHVNHIHPKGWMSSALYVSLPSVVRDADPAGNSRSGWLQFGQPPVELGLNLPPRSFLRPRVGMVALFPSYMWHGTMPFEDDAPRVTIAFDMTPTD